MKNTLYLCTRKQQDGSADEPNKPSGLDAQQAVFPSFRI